MSGTKKSVEKKKKKKNLSRSSRTWLERQWKDPYVHKAQLEKSPSRSLYKLQQLEQMLLLKTQQEGIFQQGQCVIDLGAAPGGWTRHVLNRIGPQGFLITVDLLNLKHNRGGKGPSAAHHHHHHIQADFRTMETQQHIQQLLLLKKNQEKGDGFIETEVVTMSNNDTSHDFSLSTHKKKGETTTNELLEDKDTEPHQQQQHHQQQQQDRQPQDGLVDVVLSDMAPNFTGDASTDALRTMALCEAALTFATRWLRKGGTFIGKFLACGRENEDDLCSMAKQHFECVHRLKPPASRKESAELYLCAVGFSKTRKRGGSE